MGMEMTTGWKAGDGGYEYHQFRLGLHTRGVAVINPVASLSAAKLHCSDDSSAKFIT